MAKANKSTNVAKRTASPKALAAHKAATLRKTYGVLVGGRLVFQCESLGKAFDEINRRGVGSPVALMSGSPRVKRDRTPAKNPVADKLATKHAAMLDTLQSLVEDVTEIPDPHGRTAIPNEEWRSGSSSHRTATNKEAGVVKCDVWQSFELDVRKKDAPQDLVRKLRELARNILAAARRVEVADKKGRIPRAASVGFFVVKGGKVLKGPVGQPAALVWADQEQAKAVRRYSDGSETVIADRETPAPVVKTNRSRSKVAA